MFKQARKRGFTLVELLTVITIMAILVTLLLGAVQSVRRFVAANATTEMFEALDAALKAYYDDWGSYPWSATDGDYAAVTLTNDPYTAIPSTLSGDNLNAAILYVALTTRKRHGPYFRGGVSAANTMKTSTGAVYYVFRDGWGRMIYYMAPSVANNRTRSPATLQWAPPTDASVTPTLKMMPPVLESLGPDEFNDSDNMVNYGQLQQ